MCIPKMVLKIEVTLDSEGDLHNCHLHQDLQRHPHLVEGNKELWKKENTEVEVNQEAGLKPKRQRLMTNYHQRVPTKQEQVQAQVEGRDQEAPVEDPDPDAQDDSRGNQEVEALRTPLAEERIIQRGQKAMLRSKKKGERS